MNRPQVFVYLQPKQKQIIRTVSEKLGCSESELAKLFMMPAVEKIYVALRKGVSPSVIRKKIGMEE